MNGPDHYRAAERLLAGTPKTNADRERGIEGNDPWPPTEMELRAAQVHATLALAAATALNDFEGGMSAPDYNTWMGVAGVNGTETAAG